ncbi:HAMP domain-containing sensor histidine kinase [Haloplanus salilacus]|uniref:sensor histidine kinase n=1 Tax=Haloplanus salilacus TaxID=2949994 RepID=UPI0030D133D4
MPARRPIGVLTLPVATRWTGYWLLLTFFVLFFRFHGVSIGAILSVEFVVGVLTTLPFVGAILYGGYWLERSDLPTERYPRIGRWFGVGLVGFLLLNVAMILVWPADSTYDDLSWALFAAAVGGAGGLGMGLFEARAIDRAVAAERNRVRREELARRNEQLERFAGLVSHDLRNPLNVASGRLALACQECDSDHLDAVATAHDRMEAIVERTLALARSGRIIGDTESVDLATVVEECWEVVTTADATLRIEASTTVEADPDRIRHLFENLFRNSVEHSSTESRTESGDGVEHAGRGATVTVGDLDGGFYVEDDGVGIPAEERDDVFDAGYSTDPEGTGFGLSIVEQIAEAHGWRIRVVEGTDGGARFEVRDVD